MDRQEAESVFAKLMEIDDTKVLISIDHVVRGLKAAGFGYDEINAMVKAMEEHDFSGIVFI